MKKISIKREQSQVGLSFAEREKFRPQVKIKLLLLLVLLMTAATGAWAQTETLLTTITATAKEQASYSTANVATVSFSYTAYGSSAYLANWGWWGYGWTATVTAVEGYTITKCVFYDDANRTATDSEVPFVVETIGEEDKTPIINGTPIDGGNMQSKGIKKIEVYGYATPAATGYSITLDEGTGNKDSQNWEITPQSSELGGGEAVTVKYNGSREVKSVTVVKKAAANPNTYLTWDNKKKELVATPMPESFTTVTSSTTAWSAGYYVVEGEVNITSRIVLSGDVNLIIKDGAKLTVNNSINGDFNNLSIYGQAQKTGQLVVNCSDYHAISDLSTLEVHSAEVTATASGNDKRGGISIDKFNVYGGSVDAKSIAANGGYGILLSGGGTMDIYGGEVKAEGKGTGDWDCGIVCGAFSGATVTVHGGKLWAGNADKQALNYIDLKKGDGFTGKIETSSDNEFWEELAPGLEPTDKYVRVGY